jgi:hypothetical protein
VSGTPSTTTFTANLGSGGLSNSGSGPIGATAMKAAAFTVTYPAYTGADAYEVRTRCGNIDVAGATSPTIDLPLGCAATTLDFEVVAKSGSTLLAWTQKTNVAFTAGGSTTISDAWQGLSQLTATYTNVPAVSEIDIQRFSPYRRGLPLATATDTPMTTTVLSVNASKPARSVIATTLSDFAMGGVGSQIVTEVVDGSAATYALDVGANLLPWVKGLYVPQTTTLEVTTMGSGAYDIFEANLRYTRGQVIYTWRVFGPLAQTVKFPALPAAAPGNPTVLPTDVMSGYNVFVGESDAVGGYRDAIKNVYEALGTAESSANPSTKVYTGTKNRISRWN